MSPVWAIWTFERSTPSSSKISTWRIPVSVCGPRVGHDRRPGPHARAGDGAVHLLDVLGDAGLVRGAFQERGLDPGSLDALLDVVDEEVGHRARVAGDEEHRQVVVRVDAGARDDLKPRFLGDSARELDVAAAEHPGRLADRLDALLDDRPRALASPPRGGRRPDVARRVHRDHRSQVRPPGCHRLVAVDQMLVDKRRPELIGFDRSGYGLDGRHGGRRSLRAPCRRSWIIAMTILIACLIASMVIGLVKLL